MSDKYSNFSASDFLKQKNSQSPSSSPAPVSSSTRSSTKNPYAGVSASDFLASKSSASSPLSNPLLNSGSGLESNLRVTPDKWNAVNGGYEAYENNRNSPDFVYDENVNRNQYNSVKSLMDDIDADIAFYRQQGENITADNLQYNREQLQENLDKLDKEYNDNKAPEAEKEGANNSESLGFWDTLRNIFSGGFKGTIGNTVEGQRNLYALGQGARDAETNEQIERWTREVERAQRAIEEDTAAYGADSETVQGDRAILENAQRMLDAYNVVPEAQRGAVEETAKLSDEIAAASYEDIQAAKEGKGKVGQIAVDVGTNAVQMAGDVLLGKLLGTGNGMLPMAVRSYGGAVQEARQAGATEQEQAAYGLTKAGIEVMTEKIADGLAGAYGKGTADDIIESVIGKMSSNNAARNALRLGFSALGEGSEELASDLLDPVAKAIYDKGEALKTKYTDPEAWKEAVAQEAYDMLIGSIMGFGGGTLDLATGGYTQKNAELNTPNQTAQETAPQNTEAQTTEQTASTPLAETVNRANQQTAEETAQTTPQNSPLEQTSATETNTPLSETVLNATEAQQNASAPTVSEVDRKAQQFDIIQKSNPSNGGQQAWIESVDDIKTWQEALEEDLGSLEEARNENLFPDFKASDLQEALDTGYITVYSSGDITDGAWVTPSAMEARDYAGSDNIQAKRVPVDDIAWLDSAQGMYAPVEQNINQTVNPLSNTVENAQTQQAGTAPATEAETQNADVTGEAQTESQAWRPDGQGEDVREHNTSERIRERKTIVHDALVEETQADPSYYKVKHNKDTVAAAEAVLFNEDGSEADLNEVASHAEEKLFNARNGTGKIMPEDVLISVQVADRLMEHANVLEQSGLTQEAQSERARADRIMSALYAEQAEAGQLSQAGRLISKASPATQRQMRQDYLDRCLKEWNDRLTKGQGRKMQKKTGANTIQLPTELAEAYVNAKTDADLQKAYSDIVTYVGQNTPSTLYQQITALRFLNMLGNPVTQGRNIIGNTFSFANYFVKRRIQSVFESVFAPDDKTFSMWYDLNDARAWLGLTSDPEIAANLENNGRFQDVRTQSRSKFARDSIDNQTIFGIKPIEDYRKSTNEATSGGDIIFLKMNFADAAAAYAKAHGFTLETATPEQKAVAIAVATKEAQEATFHDDTVISDIATKMRIDEGGEWANKNRANKAATKIVNALSDGLQPFRKTPANVAVRGEEFSPLGFINAFIKSGVRFHDIMTTGSSEITTSDVINQLSKALTGTGLTIAGAMLRAAGKARTSDDDDKKLNDYEKLNGLQDYAIKINGKWKTADWAAPDSIPFFMGVELYDALNGTGQFTEDDIINIFGALTGTMTEMSMLQGINDTLKGLNSFGGDDNALMKFVTALGTSYLQQLLGNSLLGRAESAATPYRQDTYLDPDSRLSSETQYALGKLGNKIPFWDFQQADYIDAWGNKVENQNTSSPITRALRSLGSPSYTSEDTTTDFDRGLMELHDQLEGTDFKGDVLPAHISRSTVIGDKRLTPEEYEIYATNVGQMRREMAESFWNSSLRETLSPEEQGKVITDIYEYCASRGKADILERRGEQLSANDDWVDDIEFFGDDANRLAKYLATKDAFNDNLNNGDYEAIDALLKTIDSFPDNDGKFANKDTQYYVDNIKGLEKYVLAAKQGVTSDMLTEAKDAYNRLNKQKDLSKSEMTTRFTSWVDNNVQTADWTDKQKDAVKSLLKYYNQVPVNTDRYEKMGDYGVDSRTISAIESKLETLSQTDGFEDLTSSQQTYKKYDVILKEAATLSDDQALALVRSYGSLGPGAGKLKYMIQQYFGDRDEDFQETLYNSVRDERDWSHNWRRTKPDNPFD